MTTEPKFVPKEAADVKLSDDIEVKIRLADCVGFMVDGANGHTENGQERQVKTHGMIMRYHLQRQPRSEHKR